MEYFKMLFEKYNQINDNIKKMEDGIEKEKLKVGLSEMLLLIREELSEEQERGNISAELIQMCSEVDAIINIEKKDKEDAVTEDKTIEKENSNNYTLASNKIISKYDGTEIDISNLSRIDKIKAIYDHTGVEINNQDPEILKLCDLRFQQFLRGCNPTIYEQKYGKDWQKVVEQIYKNNYLDTVQKCIASGLNEVDEKNRNKIEDIVKETDNSKKIVEEPSNDINNPIEYSTNTLKQDENVESRTQELEENKKESVSWHPQLTKEQIEYAIENDIYEPAGPEYEQFLGNLGINTIGTVENKKESVSWHPQLTKEQIEYAIENDIYEPVGQEYEMFLSQLGIKPIAEDNVELQKEEEVKLDNEKVEEIGTLETTDDKTNEEVVSKEEQKEWQKYYNEVNNVHRKTDKRTLEKKQRELDKVFNTVTYDDIAKALSGDNVDILVENGSLDKYKLEIIREACSRLYSSPDISKNTERGFVNAQVGEDLTDLQKMILQYYSSQETFGTMSVEDETNGKTR